MRNHAGITPKADPYPANRVHPISWSFLSPTGKDTTLNGIDGLVLIVLLLFAWQGYRTGGLARLAGLAVMAVSVGVAWVLHRPVGDWFHWVTGLPRLAATAAGFLVPFLIIELMATVYAARQLRRLSPEVQKSWWNRLLGMVPALGEGTLLAAMGLTVALVWPSRAMPRDAITSSLLGGRLVGVGTAVQTRVQESMGGAMQDLLTFRTVRPGSNERVTLPFRTTNAEPDPEAEAAMLEVLNRERARRGLRPLRADERLRTSARAHARDMLRRGYFAHATPEGATPFDRMTAVGARYGTAGENLALAPTVEIAHTGLMKSPGHRENILRPEFGRVGIGALRAPPYGIMFTQNFAD
jgi:uncharacterized protein YkwD/uncharacterized membrane protein required for colicin V production